MSFLYAHNRISDNLHIFFFIEDQQYENFFLKQLYHFCLSFTCFECKCYLCEKLCYFIENRPLQQRVRKRKLIIDEKKTIEPEKMKYYMSDTSATIKVLEMAPPNKKFMIWMENGSASNLLSSLCRTQFSRQLNKVSFLFLVITLYNYNN